MNEEKRGVRSYTLIQMQLYAITDRSLFPSPDALIEQAAQWAKGGVDYVQIREKDLAAHELSALTTRIVRAVRSTRSPTHILLNGSAEIAAQTGCDGVHLTANQPSSAIADAREIMRRVLPDPIISVSCHTLLDIERACDHSATMAIFAPIFEKRSGQENIPGQGLDALAAACCAAGPMPVFALGGITLKNAQACINAGAIGIAAIRLFASGDWVAL